MDANFFYYSIYDRFIQRQPCACVGAFVNFFFKKKTSQKVLYSHDIKLLYKICTSCNLRPHQNLFYDNIVSVGDLV